MDNKIINNEINKNKLPLEYNLMTYFLGPKQIREVEK